MKKYTHNKENKRSNFSKNKRQDSTFSNSEERRPFVRRENKFGGKFEKRGGNTSSYSKYKRDEEQGGERPFKSNFSNSEERRPFVRRENKFGGKFEKRGGNTSSYSKYKKDEEQGGEREDRPFKSNFSNSEERRPFVRRENKFGGSKFEKRGGNTTSYSKYKKDEEQGREREERPFKSNFSNSEERRPFVRRENKFGGKFEKRGGSSSSYSKYKRDEEQGGERPFKSNFSNSEERRPFVRRENKFGERKFEKRGESSSSYSKYKRDEEQGGERPFKSNFSNSEERRPFVRRENKFGERKFEKRGESSSSYSKYKRDEEQGGEREERPFKSNFSNSDERRPFVRRENKFGGSKFEKRGGNTSSYSKYKRDDIEEEKETSVMPLNKFLAHCGVCSRRDAVEIIKSGIVEVNTEKIVEPGFKINTKTDKVFYYKELLQVKRNYVYILINKPKDYITTVEDPQERRTVLELVKSATQERVYPVGRLDRNTTGVLLLTNDGSLTQKLTHPKYEIKKIYHITLDKDLTKDDFEKILKGVELEDGIVYVDELAYADPKIKNQLGIEIHSGRNRVIRRLFEKLGYDVVGLDRVLFGGLTKKNVPRGKWRFLLEKEVNMLKYLNASKGKNKNE